MIRLFTRLTRKVSLVFGLGLGLAGATAMSSAIAEPVPLPPGTDPDNTLVLMLKNGPVVIEMRPDLAPKHVARIKELVKQHFYDGLKFHRVIEGFMVQTGDPKGDGTGGSGNKIAAEFSTAHHLRGTVAMARSTDPNSADSQFYICLADQPSLDGKYTIWGQVVSGMEFVDTIKKGAPGSGRVTDPDKIITLRLAQHQG